MTLRFWPWMGFCAMVGLVVGLLAPEQPRATILVVAIISSVHLLKKAFTEP